MNAETTYHTKRWLAFYIRPRHEKRVAERLTGNGLEVFCPLICVKVRWSDRWRKRIGYRRYGGSCDEDQRE